jgi:zinc protease
MKKQADGAQSFSLLQGGEIIVAPTSARDVVSLEGSVLGGPNHMSKDKSIIAGLSAGLLDTGTKGKTKEIIRGSLADRGITLSFSAGGDRTYFSGQCFPEDLSFLLSLIADCLGGSHFPKEEVDTAKARAFGDIAEMKTNTLTQASIALARRLYDTTHVNFSHTLEETEAGLRKTDRQDLLEFRKQLGHDGLVLAVAGDVSPNQVRTAAEKAFGKFTKKGYLPVVKRVNQKTNTHSENLIPIPDKANVDVLLGAALGIRKSDPLFLPTQILTDMLGGGFASHLMQTIRERDGLTYGVYATLRGFGDNADGYMHVGATFSPDIYDRGSVALRREVKNFFTSGITEEALLKKKDEITGSYLVGLSTTRGLARMLHQITIDGRDLSYLREYPEYIRAVSIAEIRMAAALVPVNKFALVASGTFPKQ